MPQSEPRLQLLLALARKSNARERVNRALATIARLIPLPLVLGIVALVLLRRFPEAAWAYRSARWAAWTTLGLVVLGPVGHAAMTASASAGARALDRHYGLADRLANALQFAALEPSQRTGMMRAAVSDALGRLHGLKPAAAVPLLVPQAGKLASALAVALACVFLLLPEHTEPPTPVRPTLPSLQPLVLHEEELELLRESAAQLDRQAEDAAAQTAVRAFDQLIEDISARRISREEAFRKLDQIQRALDRAAGLEEGALQEALDDSSAALSRSQLTRPVADALKGGDLKAAQKALRELAQRLKAHDKKLSKAELNRLREALAAASRSAAGRVARIDEERARLESAHRRLLNKKGKKAGATGSGDASQTRKHERQLKRLDRQKKRAQQAQQQLSELDRELAKAAQDLLSEMKKSGESLEQGAASLEKLDRQKLSDKEKQELKKQLEQMRKLLQQQRKGEGSARKKQLDKFRDRARGAAAKRAGQDGAGKRRGKLQLVPSDGSPGSIEIPGAGQAPRPGSGQDGPGGSQAGNAKNDALRGAETALEGKAHDVAAAGLDSGDGPASSEIVYGAAEEGFAAAGYRKIHADYETVAEEVMAHDEIPPGYRFYIRRYFQLIRPRTE